MNIIFRVIKPEEADISTVISFSIGYPTKEKVDKVLNSYNTFGNYLIGCFIDNKLIGVIGFSEQELEVKIKHISVLNEFRTQGIGKRLVYEIINKFPNMRIIAETDGQSVGFYRSIGFYCHLHNTTYPDRYICLYKIGEKNADRKKYKYYSRSL